jgi:hypothetical protein
MRQFRAETRWCRVKFGHDSVGTRTWNVDMNAGKPTIHPRRRSTKLALPGSIGKLIGKLGRPTMPIRVDRSLGRAVGRLALVVLFCLLAPTNSPAQSADQGPSVYFGVMSGKSKPIVVTFVFSEPGGFKPIIGFSMAPVGNKCNFQRTTELELPLEFRKSPLFEPGISPDELTPDKFPEFFSIVVPAELIKLGLVTNQEESHPFTSCTRQMWEGLLDPSPKHKPAQN